MSARDQPPQRSGSALPFTLTVDTLERATQKAHPTKVDDMGEQELTDAAARLKYAVGFGGLFAFWAMEPWFPFSRKVSAETRRFRHARRNLTLAAVNVVLLGIVYALLMKTALDWVAANGFGVVNWLGLSAAPSVVVAFVLMDGWMYLWHRLNHTVPFLWRFHRTHHTDLKLDITSAVRFHPGEIAISTALRLVVVPLIGMRLWHLFVYEAVFMAIVQFHHSNLRVPDALDRAFRAAFVSPNMHRVHHSRLQPETDSNYSSVFSFWDRLGRTFKLRQDPATIEFGLDDFEGAEWQRVGGMLKTPLRSP
ncbi:MAG: sterol desaturase family protein [Candidatus Poribacteria bacterium]|nr:sterol desaturase family protein [Candidatus Poribacteria bacterium]